MARAFAAGAGAAFAAFTGFALTAFLIAKLARGLIDRMDGTVSRGIRRAMLG